MIELSFAPAGWSGIYYVGIIKYLKEKITQKYIQKNIKITTSSSGIINSMILLLDIDINKVINYYHKISIKYYNNIIGNQEKIIKGMFYFLVNNSKSFDLNLFNNKLYINYCTYKNFKFNNHIVSYYKNKKELLKYIIASSYIPFYSEKKIYINNSQCYDGYFYTQTPYFTKDTILFCPNILSNQTTCIYTHPCNVSINILFPIKNKEHINKIIEQGYYCGLFSYINYIKKNLII